MKTKLTVLAGALLLAFGGAASAQQSSTPQATPATPTQSAQPTTHGDTVSGVATQQQGQDAMSPPATPPGQVTSQVAHAQRDWTRLDTDGDGTLTDAEIQADVALAGAVDSYDTDADGQLTRAEFDAYVTATATDGLTADVDGDMDSDLDSDLDVDSDLDGAVDAGLDTDLTAGADTELEAEVEGDLEEEE